MIEFAHPYVLALLGLPLIFRLLVPPYRQQETALRLPFFRSLTTVLDTEAREGSVVIKRTRLQMFAAVLVWICVIVALAGPEELGDPIEITRAKRDVVLAIDISGSMDTNDFPGPDGKPQQRFAAVKDVVRGFVERREGDRLALIVFGTRAYVQTPLTEDLDTVIALLEQTAVGMAGPQTALGDAIGLSIRTFEASDIEQRVLVILSDGNDTASKMSPVNAAEIAGDKGVEIYAIGVGDPESTGENRLDLGILADIAQRTGGEDFFAGDKEGLEAVYERIDALTPRDVETLSWRPKTSLAHWPLLAASLIGLATLGLLFLRSGRRRQA